MVAVVENIKRVPPGKASRGTLAELVAKQKLLAERQGDFQGVQPIQSWTQGLAQVTGAVTTGLQQHQAEQSEAEGRAKLAQIQALVGESGASPQQLADMGLIDPETAEAYRKSAEDKQAAKRIADALLTESNADRAFEGSQGDLNRGIQRDQLTEQSRHSGVMEGQGDKGLNIQRDQLTEQGRHAGVMEGQGDKGLNIQRDQLTEQNRHAGVMEGQGDKGLDIQRDQLTEQNRHAGVMEGQGERGLDIEEDKPHGELGNFMADVQDWNALPPEVKNNPQNQAMFMAKVREMTALKKGMSFSVDKDGNITFSEGGVEEGTTNPDGSTKDLSLKAERLDAYETDARAANDVLPALDAADKAVGAAGYTGPFQGAYGVTDDILESVGGMFGAEPGKSGFNIPGIGSVGASLPGTSAARGLVRSGNLQQTLEKVQKTIGAISNAEMDLFSRASISLENTEENNRMLIGMARAISQRAQQRAQMAREYAANNNGNVAGFEAKVWNPYITKNPVIGSDDNGNPILLGQGPRASSVGTPQAEAPAAGAPTKSLSEMTDEELAAEEKRLMGQ